MSTSDRVQPRPTVRQYQGADTERYEFEEPTGYGWVVFAGAMLLLLATLNGIDGVAAVSNSKFFTPNATYVISDLNTYGWVLIGISIVQGLAAVGIWGQVKGVRWLGAGIAAINAIVQLMFIRAYPFWSLALFSVDILVIYGLIVHGARRRS